MTPAPPAVPPNVAERTFTEREVEEALIIAATELCSCGGGGPDDPETCPVCLFWHRVTKRLDL